MNMIESLKILRISRWQSLRNNCVKFSSSKDTKEGPKIPVNPLREIFSASQQPDYGIVYDKKPFKITCVKGKRYSWCSCGWSRSQPFCDGTHKNIFLKIKLKPVFFTVTETKEYWLCNCKQTANRPFCDGSHRAEEIQALRR